MTKRFATSHLSWSDRFALVDHYSPSDEAIQKCFGITADELQTARQLRDAGTFVASKTVDVASYKGIFDATDSGPIVASKGGATVHTKPETATKRAKQPQKRGRKGDNIAKALMSAPTSPMPVTDFMAKHGVSLAVLRQAKRFISKMDPETQAKIGSVKVKQDRATKTLMIFKASS
jgi:hypothetical protein